MYFQYVARSAAGLESTGSLEAASAAEARARLRARGLFALSLEEADALTPAARGSARRHHRKRVTREDLMTFTAQLAIMIRSGVDLAEALSNIAEETDHPRLHVVLNEIVEDISDGKSVTAAMNRQVETFGSVYLASIAAGESSGRLVEVLDRLTNMLRAEVKLRSMLRGVLAYPIVLVFVAVLVMFALMFFVLPRFAQVFADLEVQPPWLTQMLVDAATSLQKRWYFAIGGMVALIWAGRWLLHSRAFRLWWDNWLLTAPMLAQAVTPLSCGRVFRLMGTMLQSGVSLLETITLCRASMKNRHLDELFARVESEVIRGAGMSQTLRESRYIPSGAAQMISTAERTGKLGEVLASIGEYYEEQGEKNLRSLARLLEPAIIIVMGVLVSGIVMAVMIPLLDLSSSAKR